MKIRMAPLYPHFVHIDVDVNGSVDLDVNGSGCRYGLIAGINNLLSLVFFTVPV